MHGLLDFKSPHDIGCSFALLLWLIQLSLNLRLSKNNTKWIDFAFFTLKPITSPSTIFGSSIDWKPILQHKEWFYLWQLDILNNLENRLLMSPPSFVHNVLVIGHPSYPCAWELYMYSHRKFLDNSSKIPPKASIHISDSYLPMDPTRMWSPCMGVANPFPVCC